MCTFSTPCSPSEPCTPPWPFGGSPPELRDHVEGLWLRMSQLQHYSALLERLEQLRTLARQLGLEYQNVQALRTVPGGIQLDHNCSVHDPELLVELNNTMSAISIDSSVDPRLYVNFDHLAVMLCEEIELLEEETDGADVDELEFTLEFAEAILEEYLDRDEVPELVAFANGGMMEWWDCEEEGPEEDLGYEGDDEDELKMLREIDWANGRWYQGG